MSQNIYTKNQKQKTASSCTILKQKDNKKRKIIRGNKTVVKKKIK